MKSRVVRPFSLSSPTKSSDYVTGFISPSSQDQVLPPYRTTSHWSSKETPYLFLSSRGISGVVTLTSVLDLGTGPLDPDCVEPYGIQRNLYGDDDPCLIQHPSPSVPIRPWLSILLSYLGPEGGNQTSTCTLVHCLYPLLGVHIRLILKDHLRP